MQNSSDFLRELVKAQKSGEGSGVYSVCSANPFVLQAASIEARRNGTPLLVESTSNQVNQESGYSGMTPALFAVKLFDLVDKHGLSREQVILGGDHLGPNPWQNQPAHLAMDKARILVRDCVLAGYTKLHLDSSMKLGDDPPGVPDPRLVAKRTAELCQAAEQAYAQLPVGSPEPCYVIGSDVPPPGGATAQKGIEITDVQQVQETIYLTQEAFIELGLQAAWQRVVAVVVQPGVEFGGEALFVYQHKRAEPLTHFIEVVDNLVYEAHSTDYQPRTALRQMVEDHFAVLKVGPALTFAVREALFSMAWMEKEWLQGKGIELSRLPEVLEAVMLQNPAHWQKYYHGTMQEQHFSRHFSFSDRIRYYWPDPRVQKALERLFINLEANPVPQTLLSQFLPRQYKKVREDLLENTPRAWVQDHITVVLEEYAFACGFDRD